MLCSTMFTIDEVKLLWALADQVRKYHESLDKRRDEERGDTSEEEEVS